MFMSVTTHWVGELNTPIHAVTICVLCFILCCIKLYLEHKLWLILLQHHSTPVLPVVYFGVFNTTCYTLVYDFCSFYM